MFVMRHRPGCFPCIDHDRFRETIVRTLSIALDEKLCKTETEFEKRSAIAQGPFQRLPKSNVPVCKRDDPYPHDAFTDRLPISDV